MKSRPQRTLKKEVSFSGVGIHTGKEVSIRFCPAPINSGVVFQRIDLPGKPLIPAAIEYVQNTLRSTIIGVGSASVQTVEHVLAALFAYQVDNLCVQLDEGEPPVGDGSAISFVSLIEKAGIEEQKAIKVIHPLKEPLYYSNDKSYIVALPSEEYRISYVLHYPNTSVIRSQYLSLPINQEVFKNEIATCRTFALYEEITALMEQGLIQGGSLENAIVIKDDVVFSKEGLRFPDEMVRHKILDLIGDLSLVGFPFLANIIAICSGHHANIQIGKEFVKHFSSY
ncbi:MAG: UDP-3-O-acyl-N-acetylglucosamine deacetylase [Chlamydiales bacterium]